MTDEITKPVITPGDIEDAAQALREVGDICPGCAKAADVLERLYHDNLQLNQAARGFLDHADRVDALWTDHIYLAFKSDRTKEDAEQLAMTMVELHRLALVRRAAWKIAT